MLDKLRSATVAWTLLGAVFLVPFLVIRSRWLAALAGAGLLAALIGGGVLVIWIRDRGVGR
jgi:hypothetical protein